ncbi:DUF3078 domain-containing protein [Chitinophaga lutea]|uniref:DUF3078 domain-containing protein n=1 Tax=Chitinophaga lutea TaxID=2488634 RepID=A0A3N4Q3W6_9BACT|nr:DUF3078 domain-containing protein [Chitinophaga lutea]RPE13919.1 DUF3078 domain-containing protein [Chitinophaga lutea]
MKKVYLAATMMLLAATALHAQDDSMRKLREETAKKIKNGEKDTTGRLWKKGATFNLMFNQGSLTNWAAGGDKLSLSLLGTLNVFANYKKDRHSWDNNLDLAYGYVNTTSLGTRKNDDRIDFTSKYGYDIGNHWYLSGLFNLRTQFTDGYLYPADTTPELVSRFFAPAYIVLSPGVDYMPNKEFSLFMSPITARWVVVMDDSLSARGAYGVDTGKHVKSEFGAFITATWNKEILKNVTYKTKLELFSNYKKNPQNIDVFWTNVLSMKVNKWLSANVSLDMIYDDDVKEFENTKTGVMGPRLQIKQVLGIGLTAKF